MWPPDDWTERAATPDEAWQAAGRLLVPPAGGDPWSGGWRLNAAPTIRLATDGDERSTRIPPVPDPNAGALEAVLVGDIAHVDVAGRSVAFTAAPPPDVDRAARAAVAHGHGGGAGEVRAPMPGAVLAVHASVGESVEAGEPIVTLEAMKMEHVVTAPVSGRVAELLVRPADQVTRGQALATVEP
jgi:biotin carboxyl carrier protein